MMGKILRIIFFMLTYNILYLLSSSKFQVNFINLDLAFRKIHFKYMQDSFLCILQFLIFYQQDI